jgi:hypothetical protein
LRRRGIDAGDPGVSEQGANERDGEGAREGQALDVTSFAPEKAGVLLPEDAVSENAQASSLTGARCHRIASGFTGPPTPPRTGSGPAARRKS